MKRQLSPNEKLAETNNKKYITTKMSNSEGDVFSWDKLKNILEDQLADVAKKVDIHAIKQELEEVKSKSSKLEDVNFKLTARLEAIDRKSRSTNIVVNGIKSGNSQDAKNEFTKLSTNVLEVPVCVIN